MKPWKKQGTEVVGHLSGRRSGGGYKRNRRICPFNCAQTLISDYILTFMLIGRNTRLWHGNGGAELGDGINSKIKCGLIGK